MPHPVDAVYQACDQFASPQKELLYDSVLHANAQTVLEIGTNIGDSSRIFSTALRVTSGHLYSLDCDGPNCTGLAGNWLETFDCSNITFLIGSSLDYPWDRHVDVLLVDGDHGYETALSDLTRFGPWVRTGGRILIHDTRLFASVAHAVHHWASRVQVAYVSYPEGVGLSLVVANAWPPT